MTFEHIGSEKIFRGSILCQKLFLWPDACTSSLSTLILNMPEDNPLGDV